MSFNLIVVVNKQISFVFFSFFSPSLNTKARET